MAKPHFLVRMTPAMRLEFDDLLTNLRAEVPKAWKEPAQGDLVAARHELQRFEPQGVRAEIAEVL